MCENEAINGVTRDGGYAEYVLLRTEAVVRVPRDVDPVEYSPILCAGITVFNFIRKQNIILGELVAVQGLGGLGHLAVQCKSMRNLTATHSLTLLQMQTSSDTQSWH
jgi:D-arabinose 1-dehydrogenase-like Zn-dependent alcohol dehydrogenase